MITKLGPHVIRFTSESGLWAAKAAIVKALDDPAVLKVAPEHAVRVYRRYFENQDVRQNPAIVAASILGGLQGYRHPNLYVETFNETQAPAADLVRFHDALVPLLHAGGVKVCGPCWSTGAYREKDWAVFRAAGWCGLDAVALHAYWGNAGFTPWHALRYRTYWKPGDPPVLITECGRDKVEGGQGGWKKDGVSEEAYLAELVAYDAELQKDAYVRGATVFSAGPTPDWAAFDCDALAGRLAARSQAPSNGGGTPVPGPLPDLCPFAEFTPLDRNFDVGGAAPKIVVVHGTSGLGDPHDYWNRVVPSNEAASADFWIDKGGHLKQYVRMVTQTSWSNGPLRHPDLSVPFLAWLVEHKKTHPDATGNTWTVSVECEKAIGNLESLTMGQEATLGRLLRWLSETFAIPLDRKHVLGHYQFDSVTRAGCPGPVPWDHLLGQADVGKLETELWGPLYNEWGKKAIRLGRNELAAEVRGAVAEDKHRLGLP